MKAKRKQEAVAIVKNELERIRSEHKEMCEEIEITYRDPLKDIRVIEKEDHVLLTYDGAGHDYFSIWSELESPRRNLFEKLECADFHAEDNNNWSLSVWEN